MGITERLVLQVPPLDSPHGSRQTRRDWWQKKFGRIVQHMSVTEETSAQFLPSGRHVIDAQKETLTGAEDHSYHQTYSFEMDRVGQEFLDTFREKRQTSPRVRQHVVVDNSIAFWNANGTVLQGHQKAREQKDEIFNELNKLEEERIAVVRITNWFHLWDLVHSNPFHRDHKKITTADGKKAIIGSVNTGEHHDRWLDAGVLVKGPTAKIIEQDVENTLHDTAQWSHVFKAKSIGDYFRRGYWKEALRQPDTFKADLIGSIVRNPQRRGRRYILHSPTGDEIQIGTDSFFRQYREATHMAYELLDEGRKGDVIDITTPYPGMMLLTGKMLRAAKQHGSTVNLHIPGNNNYQLYNPDRARNTVVRKLLEANVAVWKWRLKKAGVHVYEYQGDEVSQGMIHFKSISLTKKDGQQKVLIGSMNLSMGLLSGANREIAVLLTQRHRNFMHGYNTFINMVKQQSRQIF